MEIDNIDLQKNIIIDKKVMLIFKNYFFCGEINLREVEKNVFILFKLSNLLFL